MNPIRLYCVTDRKLCGELRLVDVIEAGICGGVDGVQLREKDLDGRALCELATAVQAVCARHAVPLLINDRIDIALAVGAAGVHLPVHSFTVPDARRLIGPGKLIGVSTHNLEQVQRAEHDGADFVVFGPIFATPSKTAYGAPLGLLALAEVTRATSIPVIAIGGMNEANTANARSHGAAGVAAIRDIIVGACARSIESA